MAEGPSFHVVGEYDHDSSVNEQRRSYDDVNYFESSRCGSVVSIEGNMIGEQRLSHSIASSSMTELNSLYSMGEDEYDRFASRAVQSMLDNMDAMLYEPSFDNGSSQLAEECVNWTTEFPHLRVLGQQLETRADNGFQFYPPTQQQQLLGRRRSSGASSCGDDLSVDLNRLAISGRQVAVEPAPSGEQEEEILAQDGIVEETIAVDHTGNENSKSFARTNRRLPPVTPVGCLRDAILSVVFDDLKLQTASLVMPVVQRLLKAKFAGTSRVGNENLTGWTRDALRMMQPPSNVPDLYHDYFDSSPTLSTPESVPHPASSPHQFEKGSHVSSHGSSLPHGGLHQESSTLDGLLTVRSKALLSREKSNLTSETSFDDVTSQPVPSVPINRPKTSIAMLHPAHSTRATSAHRQTSTVLRPGRLVPLVEEDRRHGELQHAAGVPSSLSALSRPLASFNQFSIGPTGAGYSNGSGHIGFVAFGSGSSSAGSSQSVGVVGHAPLLSGSGAGGMPSLGPSPIPSVVSQASGSGSGNATVGLPGSVMRAQLPPISHKRDAASANINRVLAVHRPAAHSGSSSHSKDQRLLPGREREKSTAADRPSTTHTMYRSETSLSTSRRPAVGPVRHVVTAFDMKRNKHSTLNVTGSSIVHPAERPLSPGLELPEHGIGQLRRLRASNIAVR